MRVGGRDIVPMRPEEASFLGVIADDLELLEPCRLETERLADLRDHPSTDDVTEPLDELWAGDMVIAAALGLMVDDDAGLAGLVPEAATLLIALVVPDVDQLPAFLPGQHIRDHQHRAGLRIHHDRLGGQILTQPG